MPSRRAFPTRASAGLAAAPRRPSLASAAAARGPRKSALNGPVGLQLWSLRDFGPKDVPGTLAKASAMGFRDVESAGLWGHTLPDFRAALDKAGLKCRSSHMDLGRLTSDLPGALAEAKGLGAAHVICPWIPHEKGFTR